MTPPKPVDLEKIKSTIKRYSRLCEWRYMDGTQIFIDVGIESIIFELEYLRARVKELEDDKGK